MSCKDTIRYISDKSTTDPDRCGGSKGCEGRKYKEGQDDCLNCFFRAHEAMSMEKHGVPCYTVCHQCETYEKAMEDPTSHEYYPTLIKNALVSIRCYKGHMASYMNEGQFKKDRVAKAYTEFDAEAYETPPRPLKDNEFWCKECRAIYQKTKEIYEGLEKGKVMFARCNCGFKVRFYPESKVDKKE